MTLQAVILAAGEGTRLRPLTQNRPKALIPVANKPIIEHTILSLVEAGIRDIIVVVGYRKEQVMRHLARLSLPVMIVRQTEQMGTGHALLSAKEKIAGDVIVLPGDNYIDPVSIRNIAHNKNSLLYTTHKNPSNFGVVTIENENITRIIEKPVHANRMTVSCGVYHLSSDIIRRIQTHILSEAIDDEIRNGTKISAIKAQSWQDAIYPWDLLVMNKRLLSYIEKRKSGIISSSAVIEGLVSIGSGTKIGPGTVISGPVIIGDDCTIGPHVVIEPGTSIGSRVKIEPFSTLKNSIIMDDVVIAPHCSISGSVIGEGCTIGEYTSAVFMSGFIPYEENAVRSACGVIMGNGVFCKPSITFENTIVGNEVHIEGTSNLKFSCTQIPDKTRVI